MLRFIIRILALNFILFSGIAFASDQLIYVSGVLDNQTSTLPFSGFKNSLNFRSDAITSQINMKSFSDSPTTGNFYVGLLPNTNANIQIGYFDFPNFKQINLCVIQVNALSTYHATLVEISQNITAPYSCTLWGDPDSNTAKITISDRT